MRTKTLPVLPIKASVRTTQENTQITDWAVGTKERKKWGVMGKVITINMAHGECYEIRHEDGSTAWYDRSELQHRVRRGKRKSQKKETS